MYTPVTVRVAGLPDASEPDPDRPVILRSASLVFIIDHPVLLRLPLCDACQDMECEPGKTCVQHTCIDEHVDVATLPEDDGSEPLEGPECPRE